VRNLRLAYQSLELREMPKSGTLLHVGVGTLDSVELPIYWLTL